MVVSRLDLQQLSGHHAKIMAEHDTDFKIIEIFSLPYWRGIFKNNLFHRDPLYGALCEKNKHRFMQNIFERVFCYIVPLSVTGLKKHSGILMDFSGTAYLNSLKMMGMILKDTLYSSPINPATAAGPMEYLPVPISSVEAVGNIKVGPRAKTVSPPPHLDVGTDFPRTQFFPKIYSTPTGMKGWNIAVVSSRVVRVISPLKKDLVNSVWKSVKSPPRGLLDCQAASLMSLKTVFSWLFSWDRTGETKPVRNSKKTAMIKGKNGLAINKMA